MRIRPGASSAMFRVVTFFFSTHPGRLLAGSIFLISGLFYGCTSHTVVYHYDTSTHYNITLDFHDESYYLQPDNAGNKYYIIPIADFQPEVPDLTTAQNNKMSLASLIFSNDQQNLNKQYSDTGTSIIGTGYQVVAFTLIDNNGTQHYATSEYTLHPNGFNDNHWWGYGIIGIILGILFFSLSWLVYSLDKRARIRSLQSGPTAL